MSEQTPDSFLRKQTPETSGIRVKGKCHTYIFLIHPRLRSENRELQAALREIPSNTGTPNPLTNKYKKKRQK